MGANNRIILFLFLLALQSAFADTVSPYQSQGKGPRTKSRIDELLSVSLQKHGLEMAAECADPIFCRRVYLDLTGQLPEPHVIRNFLNDKGPNKRAALINRLMDSDAFADYWTMKWCDILRVKAEFPINMWPNGVQAYARWIRTAIRDNMAYDQFTRELLTSSGSNFRTPQVNFYRGVQGEEPSAYAAAAGLTFMGVRLEKMPDEAQQEMSLFFSRVKSKSTAEWKEFVVINDPAASDAIQAVFPDGRKVRILADQDPRNVFTEWLLEEGNAWFARNIANRAWSWFFGYGFVHEPDDIRQDNPPVHPQVLKHLEREVVRSGYDLRHVFRIILNSAAYQQVSTFDDQKVRERELFDHYPVRRLDAEVLVDALSTISGNQEEYMSMIPEPFTFVPRDDTSVQLVDGSITSKFLKMFGRPARDTGRESERDNQVTDAQRLHLLNSSHVAGKISKGWKAKQAVKKKVNPEKILDDIYLTVLSRYPTEAEIKNSMDYAKRKGRSTGTIDLFWSLVNSKEFLYRH